MARTVRKTASGRRGRSKGATKGRTTGKRGKSAPQPPQPPVTAIVRSRERTLRQEEIDLLKKTVAKGTDDQEFLLFMTICRKHRIDPFTKQIYCVIWPTNRGQSHEMVIITGINGYRMMAARDHKDFAGTSDARFTWPDTVERTPAGRRIPESATVFAYRKGAEPSSATVYWEEFAPVDLKASRSDFWNRLPKHMLAKCAESHALRKAFPDLSDIFTEEEMSQRLADLTPGGRQISHDGVAPSGKNLRSDRQLNPSVNQLTPQEVLDAKKRGDWCDRHHGLKIHCPADEHTQEENDALFQQQQRAKTINVDAKVTDTKPKPKPRPHTVPEGADMQRGTIHRVIFGKVQKTGEPKISVKINGIWHDCYSKTIQQFFPSEAEMVTKVIEFYIDKAHCIVGLHRLGNLYFERDGRTPIKREPGEE